MAEYLVASKPGSETYVVTIDTFAFGPEETNEQQVAKYTSQLEAKGFTVTPAFSDDDLVTR